MREFCQVRRPSYRLRTTTQAEIAAAQAAATKIALCCRCRAAACRKPSVHAVPGAAHHAADLAECTTHRWLRLKGKGCGTATLFGATVGATALVLGGLILTTLALSLLLALCLDRLRGLEPETALLGL